MWEPPVGSQLVRNIGGLGLAIASEVEGGWGESCGTESLTSVVCINSRDSLNRIIHGWRIGWCGEIGWRAFGARNMSRNSSVTKGKLLAHVSSVETVFQCFY